jgi:hypothetical protein
LAALDLLAGQDAVMLWAAATPITRAIQACQESAGGPGCDLAHGLPWYFTTAVVTGWLLVMVAAFVLLRHRIRTWVARRAEARARRRSRRPALPPAHGTDIDLY